MNSTAIQKRWELIKETQELQPRFQYAAGVPDFQFPSFDSWVCFNFENDNPRSGELVWHGAREWVGSVETDLWSNDPSLEPPLSAAEIAYQCGNQPRCKLAWSVGETSFYVPRVPFGRALPGFKDLAEALGYRWVAGVSGTTANMLEIGRILGFTDTELVALRATMLAWMLVKDDHSFFEIMLGAEPFMAHGFHMAMGLQDFAQLFPKDVETATGTAFSFCDVWVQIRKKLLSSEGLDLLQSMDERSRRYTVAVLSNCTAHELPTRATLSASTAKASEVLVSMLAMVGLMGWFLRWRQRQSDSKELKLDPKQSNLLS